MKTIALHWEVDGRIETYTVPETDAVNIGRSAQHCKIVLPRNLTTVSRKHASIVRKGDLVYLRNLSQKNQIRVNDRQSLASEQETQLQDGDAFSVGPVVFRVVEGPSRTQEELKIRCRNCKTIYPYDPDAFCKQCGLHLSSMGETILPGQD